MSWVIVHIGLVRRGDLKSVFRKSVDSLIDYIDKARKVVRGCNLPLSNTAILISKYAPIRNPRTPPSIQNELHILTILLPHIKAADVHGAALLTPPHSPPEWM